MTARRVLLVATAVGAVLGAGFGWYWAFPGRSFWSIVWVLVVAVALGVLVPLLLVRIRPAAVPVPPPPRVRVPPARPPTGVPPVPRTGDWWTQPGPARSGPGPAAAPTGSERGPAVEPGTVRISTAEPAQPVRREPAHLVLPIDGAHPGPWPVPTDPVRATAPGRPGAADLAAYRESARIVQCPRCGSFRVDLIRIGGDLAFRCRADDHEWTWRPGTAWPATVVASRRRTHR